MSLDPVILNTLALDKDGQREPRFDEVFLATTGSLRPRDLHLQSVTYLRADFPRVEAEYEGPLMSYQTYTAGGTLPSTVAPVSYAVAFGNTVMETSGNPSTLIRRSADRGATWASVTVAAWSAKVICGFRYIAGIAIAAFTDGSIFRSTDDGLTWSLVGSWGTLVGISLTHAGTRWFATYSISGQFSPGFRFSDDAGATWSANVYLPDGAGTFQAFISRAAVAADGGGKVFVMWGGVYNSEYTLFSAYSSNYGSSFVTSRAVTNTNYPPLVAYAPTTKNWFRALFDPVAGLFRVIRLSDGSASVLGTTNVVGGYTTAGNNALELFTFGRLAVLSHQDVGSVFFVEGASASLSVSANPGYSIVSSAVEGSTVYVFGSNATNRNGRYELANATSSFTVTNVASPGTGLSYYRRAK